jgi:hypothetical protein
VTAAPALARLRATRHGPRPAGVAAGLLAIALASGQASSQSSGGATPRVAPGPIVRTSAAPYRVRATVSPAVTELGRRVVYKAWLHAERPASARWLPPDSGAAFTWGTPRASATATWGVPTGMEFEKLRRKKLDIAARHDIAGRTLLLEIPLQAFALGRLTVPGVQVEIDDGRGPRVYRLPVVTLDVLPVLTAADSNADYRALHGPLAAPWWERVPWTWVVLGLLVLAAAIVIIRAWRRRRVATPAAVPAAAALDPRAEALAALADLQALRLPEHARFAEHAFRLGQILRRFLEATTGATQPGDTTPELVLHLQEAGLEPDDLARLSGLLRVWDRVKFAREPFTLDEAIRAERAIEMFLRRPPAPAEKVA